MSIFRIATLSAVALMACGVAAGQDYDKTFLTDYTKLQAKPTADGKGTDLMYIAPGAFEKLAQYNAVMVDQPEVLISPQSDYKGAKPDDLKAVAEMIRTALDSRLTAGGYNTVDAPGPGVIYIRVALTDLNLKKKKRGILGYTPIGFVVKAGTDALKDMMEKYDIMNMTLQAELVDSQSKDVLAELVAPRGGPEKPGEKPVRIDFDKLTAMVDDFGSRLRCRLDNAKVPAAQQIDCLDPKARAAHEASKPAN